MKLLACTFYYYYGNPAAIEPQFYYLYKVPESLGFSVDFLDYNTAARIGIGQMRRLFLSVVKGGNYDMVFIATHRDEFDEDTLAEAKKYCPVVAWNSDDEWRWDDYSKKRVSWYTFMVTNDPAVYESNKGVFPNLLHAQWGCTGFWDGRKTAKDIDFSFVGQVYGSRDQQLQWLCKHAGLQVFGKGSKKFVPSPRVGKNGRTRVRESLLHGIARFVLPRLGYDLDVITFEQVNSLWNRSKVSFTPLDSSRGKRRQIKSRVFDMGLSGTLMLAPKAPHLERYYEPGKEYVEYEDLEDCAEKARHYLANELARRQIALAYGRRTQAEHLWKYRIQHVLKEAGIVR